MKENGGSLTYINEAARVEHEQKEYEYMFATLNQVRNEMLTARELDKQSGEYTYNPFFNMILTGALKRFENPFSRPYLRIRNEVQSSIMFDVQTMLSERFHVGVSKFSYQLKEGKLVTADGIAMVDMVKRGRDFRRMWGKPVDWEREDAEVQGAEQIEEDLTHPDTPIGTVRGIISPPGGEGSIYTQNFYDLYTKTATGVEARRYTSGLKKEEYIKRLHAVDERISLAYIPTAEEFLRSPLRFEFIMSEADADSIHEFFHKEHVYMNREDFAEILDICNPLISRFVAKVIATPHDQESVLLLYNSIINTADKVEENIKRRNEGKFYEIFTRESTESFTEADIRRIGQHEVERRMTGCGMNAGFGVNMIRGMIIDAPFSLMGPGGVMDFSTMSDDKGPLTFTCPNVGCGKTNIRPYGQLLERCLHCNADVRCGNTEKREEEKEDCIAPEPIKLIKKDKKTA